MTLSSNDAAILRLPVHQWQDPYPLVINTVPLEIVVTAIINQTAFSYPLATLTVDSISSLTDWTTYGTFGRLVMIGTAPGSADVGYFMIRKASTSTQIYLAPVQQGQSIFARDIDLDLDDNYYVSVCKPYAPAGIGSRIYKKRFYKFYDLQYSDQGRNPRAIVRLGEHQQAWVNNDTGLARFTIDVDAFDFPGRAYSSHTWGTDGQTTISSSASQLVVDCEPGCHEITYSRTDTKGKTTLAYRYLFANHPTLYPPLNAQHSFQSIGMTQERPGFKASARVSGDFSNHAIYPGQLFLMTERPIWRNPVTGVSYTVDDLDDPDSICDNFVGYLAEHNFVSGRGVQDVTLTIEAPVVLSNRVRIEKQYIAEKANPNDWSEVTTTLSNPVGAFYYLTAHHAPYLLDGHDFQFETFITNLRRKTFDMNKSEMLGGQLEQLAQRLDGHGGIGSRANGTTYMVRNSQYFPAATRAAQNEQWNWLPGDVIGQIEQTRRYWPTVGKVYMGAFAHNGTVQPFRSLAPGPIADSGSGTVEAEDTTVTATAGQARTNEIAGLHRKVLNNAIIYGAFLVNGNMDFTEPCNLDDWHGHGFPTTYDPIGEGWSGKRLLPMRVTRSWTGPGTPRKEIRVEFEPEVFGYPGITVPINRGGSNSWQYNNTPPQYFEDYRPQVPDLGTNVSILLACNALLYAGRSDNFGDQLTGWSPVATQVVDVTLDWHSAYFGDPTDPLIALALVWEEFPSSNGRLTLYSLEYTPSAGAFILTDGPTQVHQMVNISASDSFLYQAQIIVSREEADYWVIAWRDEDRLAYDYSTDGGSNWAGQVNIGDDSSDPGSQVYAVGLAVYDERLVAIAKDGTQNDDDEYIYFVYTASTKGGALSKLTNPTDWEVIPGAIALTSASAALVGLRKPGAPEPDNPLDVVDFDSGYPDYAVSGGQTSTGTAGHASFPGQNDMAFGHTSEQGAGGFVSVVVTVDLTALYTFSQVTFWTNFSLGTTVTDRRSVYGVELLDSGDTVLASFFQPTEGSFATGEFTVTAGQLGGTGGEQVSKVRISHYLQYTYQSGGPDNNYVFLDDIDIDATLIEYASERNIHTLNPGTGAFTERESYQLTPLNTYGMAVSTASASDVSMIAADENGENAWLLQSSNGGGTWSRIRRMNGYTGLKRSGSTMILHGYNKLELSADAGRTSYNMAGNWSSKLGALSQIRAVTGVLT